jgi:hypothetical protein
LAGKAAVQGDSMTYRVWVTAVLVAGMFEVATAQTPPFTQCPAVGVDTSCAILIVFRASGAVDALGDSTQGPYDVSEDTLLGVQNDSNHSVCKLQLSSTLAVFDFSDGDGICTLGLSGCPFGPTGYEGPGVSFTNISSDFTSGTVNFSPCIPPGGSAYFSLELAISPGQLVAAAGDVKAPAPALSPLTLGVTGIALAIAGARLLRKRRQ